MDPIIGASLFTGGSSLLSGLLQQGQVNRTNLQNRQFAMDMYNLQRRDTIADWDRTNQYNSPAAQMQRFKDAGLSPHLIYGQMTNAPAIKTPDAPKHENIVPQVPNIGQAADLAIRQYFDTKSRQADINLTQQNIENAKATKEFTEANTLRILKDTDLKAFELYMKDRLLPTMEANMMEKGINLRADTSLKLGTNQREWDKLPKQIDLMINQMALTKARTATTWTQKAFFEKQIEKLKMDTYWGRQSNAQKIETGKIVQESLLWKNLLMGRQITTEQEKSLRLSLQNSGLSSEQATNLLRTILTLGNR